MISVSDGCDYLVVPEGKVLPEGAEAEFVILQQPIDHAYLSATSAMCLFDALDGLSSIRFSGTKAENWYVERAVTAMEVGDILFAGKYSAPDYELLLSDGCDLAIESTMIQYAPEVMEKLEELGIPVWIDMSSYEPEPLGRTEWIKAYAVLLGCEDVAEDVFAVQKEYVNALSDMENTGYTVAYFYVNASGLIVTKPASDSFARMIELAGGNYVPADLEGAEGDSSVTMDAESFYAVAKDADILIYNAAIDQPPASVSDLVDINAMFADFKAVREGSVWCAEKSLYQSSDKIGLIVSDLNAILTGNTDDVQFLCYFEMNDIVKRHSRYALTFFLMVAAFCTILIIDINSGSVRIPFGEIARVLFLRAGDEMHLNIVWKIRLPRILLSAVLGGALALSGFLLQTFFRNPIAGPFVLGIASGAKMTVAIAMVFLGTVLGRLSSFAMISAAFCGFPSRHGLCAARVCPGGVGWRCYWSRAS